LVADGLFSSSLSPSLQLEATISLIGLSLSTGGVGLGLLAGLLVLNAHSRQQSLAERVCQCLVHIGIGISNDYTTWSERVIAQTSWLH
jgi:hypothetical protein